MNIPIFEKEAKKSKKEFMDMMINAYNSDPHNKVISAEKKSKAKHESGIIIDGYPDRVEINHNGNNIIFRGRLVLNACHRKINCFPFHSIFLLI